MSKESLSYFQYKEKYRVINNYKNYTQQIFSSTRPELEKADCILFLLFHETTNEKGEVVFDDFIKLIGNVPNELKAEIVDRFSSKGSNSLNFKMSPVFYRYLSFFLHDKFFYKLGDLLEETHALETAK